MMPYVYDDGGRKKAGFKGNANDCSTRAIAIATGRSYKEVYDGLNLLAKKERPRSGNDPAPERVYGRKRSRSIWPLSAGNGWASQR